MNLKDAIKERVADCMPENRKSDPQFNIVVSAITDQLFDDPDFLNGKIIYFSTDRCGGALKSNTSFKKVMENL